MLANLQHKWEEWSREVEEALRREASIGSGTQLELGEFKKASAGRPVCADCKFALWRAECSLTLMLPCFMHDVASKSRTDSIAVPRLLC